MPYREFTALERLEVDKKLINRTISYWEGKKRNAEYYIQKNKEKLTVIESQIEKEKKA